ncbi:MAG TPA: hypothetical protein VHN37_03645, partial [Actinomycetota bacterium]|nr:hypothetical protein [Actinomycetota bacterium]
DPPNPCTLAANTAVCQPVVVATDPPPVGGNNLGGLIGDPSPITVDPPPVGGHDLGGLINDPQPIEIDPDPIHIPGPPPREVCLPTQALADFLEGVIGDVDTDDVEQQVRDLIASLLNGNVGPVDTDEIVAALESLAAPSEEGGLTSEDVIGFLELLDTGTASSSSGEIDVGDICVESPTFPDEDLDVGPIYYDPAPPCDNRLCSVPAIDPSPISVDPPGACDHLRNMLCPVPVVDPSPVSVTVPAPCGGDIKCDVSPQTVDPPGACDHLRNMLCPVPVVDPSPVFVDPPDVCAQLDMLVDPCYVPVVDAPPQTVDVPNLCNNGLDFDTAAGGCTIPSYDPSPVIVDLEDPCEGPYPLRPGSCVLPTVDASPISVGGVPEEPVVIDLDPICIDPDNLESPCPEEATPPTTAPPTSASPSSSPTFTPKPKPSSSTSPTPSPSVSPTPTTSPSPTPTESCSLTGAAASDDVEDPQDAVPFCALEDPAFPAKRLPFAPPDDILVLTANVLQANGEDTACPTSGAAATPGTDAYNKAKGCEAERREGSFARRVRDLAEKTLNDIDGMGAIPDVILVNEVRRDHPNGDDDVLSLVRRLEGAIDTDLDENDDGIPDDADFRIAKSRRAAWIFNKTYGPNQEEGKDPPRTVTKADTAIIYNFDTMRRLPMNTDNDPELERDRGIAVDTTYSSEDQVQGRECRDNNTGLAIALDFDGDGIDECRTRTFKRHFLIAFEKLDSDLSAAVASLHFVQKEFLDQHDDREVEEERDRAQTDTNNSKKDDWARQVATEMLQRYENSVTHFFLGGDFNIERCIPPKYEPDYEARQLLGIEEPPERSDCTERRWWTSLTGLTYADSVFAVHGGSQESLDAQYQDGDVVRDRRIDFVFARRTAGTPQFAGASQDLTCGFPDNCLDLNETERYSDHRIVWARTREPEDDPPIR